MIKLNAKEVQREIDGLRKKYAALPGHIAKKHMRAAMRRVIKPGVPLLRANTPPVGARRGRRKKGEKPRSTGALRRAVTTKAKFKGSASSGTIFGVLGYRGGLQSRKAIWLEYGTSRGISPRAMVGNLVNSFGPTAAKKLAEEMKAALGKAIAEVRAGRNPGRK